MLSTVPVFTADDDARLDLRAAIAAALSAAAEEYEFPEIEEPVERLTSTFSMVSSKHRPQLDRLWEQLRDLASESALETTLLQCSTNPALLHLRLGAISDVIYEEEEDADRKSVV